MSARRILIAAAAVVAGLLALAAAAAFNPRVQTWAARRALASLPAQHATLERLSAGLSRMSVQGLRIEMNGAVLYVPDAEAQLGVVPAVLGRGYLVRNLVAKGWTLDLTRSGAPPAPRPRQEGAGQGALASRAVGAVLAAFNVPAGLSLDGLDLDGLVILPDDGGSPIGKARVAVTGGGLAAGQEGHFACDIAATLDDPAAPVSLVGIHATLAAMMDGSGTFTRADLKADATASGREFPNGIGLGGTASAARGAGKTTYSVALVRGNEPIASVDADSPDGSRRLSGEWRLDLKDTDLAPFALGRRLPVFYVAGSGSYGLDAASGDVLARGKVQASADRLGIVAAGLDALGRIDLAADFDVARAGKSLRVDRLEASLSGESPVGSVRALQPFEFNAETGELKVARPSGDLVGISVKGIPLSWLRSALPGAQLTGSDARGEFVMRAEDGRLAMRTKAPLAATGVSLSAGGGPIAAALEVSSFLLGDYSPEGWQLQLAPLSVRSDGIKLLSVEARLGRLAGRGQPIKAAGSWSASLPALFLQPFGSRLPKLDSGEASGSFQASLGATRELLVKVSAKDLSLASGPRALPALASDMRADFDSDGRTTFNLPLRLDYGARAANLVFSGTLSPRDSGTRLDAALSAERLTREDLAAVAALVGAGSFLAVPAQAPAAQPADAAPADPAPPAAQAAAPAAPFWPAIPGRLSYVVGDLELTRVDLKNVRGSLAIAPGSLRIEAGMAALGEGSAVRYEGELAFAPGASPYALRASVSADNVDSAPLFRAMDPDKPPAVDGRFDIEARVSSSGSELGDLLQGVQGDCRLASKDGRFRALRTDAIEAVKQAPSALINALDSVSSLFGKKSDKIGEALVEAASGLSEIHYDQMNVTAERGPDLDIRFTEINLIAPEERITGTGRISHADGVPVEWQPLSVDLDMGVRGKLGGVLGIIGMLKEGRDELGYTQLYQPIHLGGTLRNIDHSQWKEMLVQAPLRKGGGLFDKLLGK